jgi:hypothetical protein
MDPRGVSTGAARRGTCRHMQDWASQGSRREPNMPIDIYTRTPITEDSSEHVLPDALGGRLQVRGIIDRTTNSKLGEGIDASLERELRVIRIFLDAPNSRGEPPAALTGLKAEDGAEGEAYDVASGGIVRPRPTVRTFEWKEKQLTIDATIPDERSLRDMLRKKASKRGLNLDDLMKKISPLLDKKRAAMPNLGFGLNVWQLEPYRATAKIACNLLAHRHSALLADSRFSGIREFVWQGTHLEPWPVQVVNVEMPNGLGEFDHLVRVGTVEGEVIGLVVYFSHIALVVRLGCVESDCSLDRSYRVDQVGRRHRVDDPCDLAIALPAFGEAAARPYEEFAALAYQQGEKLIRAAREYQRSLWIRRILLPHWERFAAQRRDREATVEEVSEFVTAVVNDFVEELRPNMIRAAEDRMRSAERELLEQAAKGELDE